MLDEKKLNELARNLTITIKMDVSFEEGSGYSSKQVVMSSSDRTRKMTIRWSDIQMIFAKQVAQQRDEMIDDIKVFIERTSVEATQPGGEDPTSF